VEVVDGEVAVAAVAVAAVAVVVELVVALVLGSQKREKVAQ
jgi:hypothetical protein